MGTIRAVPDPANVVESLVYTLLDVFSAARDLHITLKRKERRDLEKSRRYSGSRRSYRSDDDDEDDGDEPIVLDKAAVNREFGNGYQDVGQQFAVGDVITQTLLQQQIIALQSCIITIFLYGPTSSDPISTHLATLLSASRSAGTASVDALAAQHQRMLGALPVSATRPANFPQEAPPYPVTIPDGSTSSPSTALQRSKSNKRTSWPSNPPSRNPSFAPTHSHAPTRPRANRTDTESTAFSGPTSYGENNQPHSMFCLYAIDLQRHPQQLLSSTISSPDSGGPYCPNCKRSLHLTPGRSWEIFKETPRGERSFHVQNRFVVKCHREGEAEGYSCYICHRGPDVDTVCGDVKALVRHVWTDHSVEELMAEDDIVEVVEGVSPSPPGPPTASSPVGRGRRDSRRDSGKYFREYEVLEVRNKDGGWDRVEDVGRSRRGSLPLALPSSRN